MTRSFWVLGLLLIAVFFTGSAYAFADTLPDFITKNLAPGDTGSEVSLLQTWLAKDTNIYPEAKVNGIYGDATKKAVERYQAKKGVILNASSSGTASGIVGPMTRANLNADFSQNQGGIASVEAPYGDAWVFNGTKFVHLKEVNYAANVPVASRINVWLHPAALGTHDAHILTNADGYGVGLTEDGKIFAETPFSRAQTAKAYVKAGSWQHVSIIFTDADAVFIYENDVVETVPLLAAKSDFFSVIFGKIADSLRTLAISTSAHDQGKPPAPAFSGTMPPPRGIFGGVASFFRNLFGGAAYTPPPITAPTSVVATKEPAPVQTPSEIPPPPTGTPTVQKPPVTISPPTEIKPPVFSILVPPTPRVPYSPFFLAITTSTIPTPRLVPMQATTTIITATTTASSSVAATKTSSSTASVASTSTQTTPSVVASGGSGHSAGNNAPTITLSGSSAVSVDIGTLYTDPGATATDPEEGNLTGHIIVGGDTVNPDLAGTYHITYSVSDAQGLAASPVTRTVTVNPPSSIPTSQQEPSYTLAPAGQDVALNVSGGSGEDPSFSSVDINPLHVYVGDTQTFTVNVSSASGVASVDAVTQLDTITHTLHLTKTADNGTSATFSASWTVYDTHTEIYRTTFTATSNSGATNSTTMAWSDPCTGVTQGSDSSLSANCTVSTVYGLDGGNLTINTGVTLTLNSGATWAFNPGTTVTISGTGKIVKGTGGSLKKGYLWYHGTGNFNADTSFMVFDTSNSSTTAIRVSTYSQGSYYSQSSYYSQISYCFAPGTLILMADGSSKPISEIRVGDWVMGQDESGRHKPELVATTFVHDYQQIGPGLFTMLKLNGSLLVRPEHPMFTTRGLVNAGDLQVGDTLIGLSGLVPLTSVEAGPSLPFVYNLEVYPDHDYFAGGFLVHNKVGHQLVPPR